VARPIASSWPASFVTSISTTPTNLPLRRTVAVTTSAVLIAGRRYDDRRDRPAMPLAAAAPALEFRAHCGAHDQLLFYRVGAHHGQVQ
jgi:hypothetical protein